MAKIDLFEWSTFYYRVYKTCDAHWVALGRPENAKPPRPDPMARYIELSDEEKLQRFVELLAWAIRHNMPLLL